MIQETSAAKCKSNANLLDEILAVKIIIDNAGPNVYKKKETLGYSKKIQSQGRRASPIFYCHIIPAHICQNFCQNSFVYN